MWGGNKSRPGRRTNLWGRGSFALADAADPPPSQTDFHLQLLIWYVGSLIRWPTEEQSITKLSVTCHIFCRSIQLCQSARLKHSRLSDQAVQIKYKLGFCWYIVYFPPQMFSESQFFFLLWPGHFFMLYHRLHCYITHFKLLWLVVSHILLFWLIEGHILFALIGCRLIKLCPGAFWSRKWIERCNNLLVSFLTFSCSRILNRMVNEDFWLDKNRNLKKSCSDVGNCDEHYSFSDIFKMFKNKLWK